MPLLISALFFAVFLANVVLGSAGRQVFLSDVQEMLVLMAASIAFVVAILAREAQERRHQAGKPAHREEES